MPYHLYVPKGYNKAKKRRLEELKKRKEFEKRTEWRTKYYII